MPPLTSTSSTATATATAAAAVSTSPFAAFVLDRAAHNPFLINETPHSLNGSSCSSGNGARTNVVPSTLDPAQRAVLLQPATTTPSAANAAAVTAILQRALVDTPLLPCGGAHTVHELVWPSFVACAEAARQVGCYATALALHDARAMSESAHDANAATTAAQTPFAPTIRPEPSLAESPFGDSPLAIGSPAASPTSSSPQGKSSSISSSNPARILLSPEELSVSLSRDLLVARHAQAQARLTELKVTLQRSVARLRRVAHDLHAYDAMTVAELRRQRQATMQELTTPVAAVEATVPLCQEIACAEEGGAQHRKRQRAAE
ncbi:hypothetical protein N2W54_001923 [Lotmaria passim]